MANAQYANTIIPSVSFIDKQRSLLITDHSMIFYKGLKQPKEVQSVELEKEIKQVVYDKDYIAFILKNPGQMNYELRIYNSKGEQIKTVTVGGEYSNIKLVNKQVILYEGTKCVVFDTKGICKYEGTMDSNIIDIYPIAGLNKYMMISANGFQEIQFVK